MPYYSKSMETFGGNVAQTFRQLSYAETLMLKSTVTYTESSKQKYSSNVRI